MSREFQVHPSSIVVVGSTRTGFSLNPKRRLRPVRRRSDIDVAIVSADLFDDLWERVYAYSRADRSWDTRWFRKTLFKGWIDPRSLPTGPTFEAAAHWGKVFDDLMQSRRFGLRSISARLYRTWERLELYHEQSVLACKQIDWSPK